MSLRSSGPRSFVPGMQDDASDEIRAAFQHGVRLGRFRERQDRVDGHPDATLLKQLRDDPLIVSGCAADAVHVELLADHVDDPQRNRAQLSAYRAERAAQPYGV